MRASSVIVFTLLAAAVAAASAQGQPLRYNVVELQAEASREVANDLMVASMVIEDTNANPAALPR